MAKIKALLKLVKIAAKYGSKVVRYLKAAFSTIWKFGNKAVQWISYNIGKVVAAIMAAGDVAEFIEWLIDIFEKVL